MTLYEIMFIVQPGWEGDALEEAILQVKNVIEGEKGTVVLLKKLGKRRLAYAINDFREGSYVLLNVQAGRELIPVLEHFFRVNEGYLRYIMIRLEKGQAEEKIGVGPAEKETLENAGAEEGEKELPGEPSEESTSEKTAAGDAPVEEGAVGGDTGNAPAGQEEQVVRAEQEVQAAQAAQAEQVKQAAQAEQVKQAEQEEQVEQEKREVQEVQGGAPQGEGEE